MPTFPRKCALALLISCSLSAIAAPQDSSVPARKPATPVPAEPVEGSDPGQESEPEEGDETSTTEESTAEGDPATEMGGVEVQGKFVEGSTDVFTEEKRAASEVTEQLGAEQIARSGDSDASSALKRVTGLTLVNDKFIYVRGLGERYSSTLLNNAQIPSPDPTRRVVPLDLFRPKVISCGTHRFSVQHRWVSSRARSGVANS